GVLAGHADRERAVAVDQADDVTADLAHRYDPDDLLGLRGGHGQPGGERGLDAQLVEVGVDLRAAAVDHDRLEPGVAHEDDVLGERLLQRVVGHGVAAVLDDDGGAVEVLQPRQRLDQGRGLLLCGSHGGPHVEYAAFSWTYSTVRSVVCTVAVCGPADRSTVMVTSRGRMSTLSRSSPTAPPRQIQMPLMATLSRSGSNSASVVPTAASTRPQLGSSPLMAHLSRLERATARPTVTASSSEAAPITSMAMALLAPSASTRSCLARSAQTSVTFCSNSARSGRTPAAPLDSSSTVSLV